MPRVKITEAVLGRNSEGFLLGLDGASVQINVAGGSAATVYEDASSGTTITNPVTSDNGRLPGYLNEGRYEQVVTYGGTTFDPVPFEARAGYPNGAAGTVLSNDGAGNVSWVDPNSVVGAAPWVIDIDPFMTPSAGTATRTPNSSYIGGGYASYGSAIDNEAGWDAILAAGEWTIELLCSTGPDVGTATVSLDGVTAGTIDMYAASDTQNVIKQLAGVTVASTGRKRLLFKQATKNASSTGYILRLQKIRLLRTA